MSAPCTLQTAAHYYSTQCRAGRAQGACVAEISPCIETVHSAQAAAHFACRGHNPLCMGQPAFSDVARQTAHADFMQRFPVHGSTCISDVVRHKHRLILCRHSVCMEQPSDVLRQTAHAGFVHTFPMHASICISAVRHKVHASSVQTFLMHGSTCSRGWALRSWLSTKQIQLLSAPTLWSLVSYHV